MQPLWQLWQRMHESIMDERQKEREFEELKRESIFTIKNNTKCN